MKTLLRSYYVLLVSTTLLQVLTASIIVFKDVVRTWLNVKGLLSHVRVTMALASLCIDASPESSLPTHKVWMKIKNLTNI